MKTQLVLVFSGLATAASLAEVGDGIHSFTTLSGKTYQGVLVSQVSPDGVLFRHANGAGKVLFSDLPGDVGKKLGYDAKKAEEHEKELADRRERERVARIEHDKEVAKARASAAVAMAAQANVLQAQYNAAASSQQSTSYGWNTAWPVVWGYGGGYGWYNERIPSPSYGGRASYTVRRQVGTTGFGSQYMNQLAGGGQCSSSGDVQRTGNHTILSPTGGVRGVPYSGVYSGRSAFTNGIPALNSSFVPSQSAQRASAPVASVGRTGAPAGRGRGY